MSDRTGFATQRRKSVGDLAVDGLFSGMAAGLAMAAVLLVAGLLDGAGIAETLGRFDPGNEASPVMGALLHLAVSGLYGAVFALGFNFLRRASPGIGRYTWLAASVYGLALWLTAHFLLLPDLNAGLAHIAPIQFALAHLVYGVALGYFMGRHTGG